MHSNYIRRSRILAVVSLGTILSCSLVGYAQSLNRQIGTQFTVTADPLVPRPHTKSCVVPLFTNYQFAFFSETTQNYQFAPPANCPGPWNKVVLDIDISETAGRQFDRTASLYMGNTNLYFGTTPEPIRTAANAWHIERDITDYSALLANPQQGFMILQNCTTDCPPPYNTLLTGVFTVSAFVEFFPTPGQGPAPRVADEVLPLVQTNAGGSNFPAFLFSPTDQFSTTFSLPQNIEQAYLDVIAQSQSTDEQWYGCFPNDLGSINEVYLCGNTDFRETEVTIDGQPAGIAPVSPWVYTGFLPDQWRPMPAAQTLDFIPYRVNLTPFASMLNDGQPHTIALSVFNDDSYFSAAASLLLYLDRGSAEVTGALTQNTLTVPSPVVSENLQGTSTVTGTIGVTSARSYTIAGYVNTSHGQVSTSISQQQNFSSTQTIDFDVVNFTVLDQNTDVETNVISSTTVNDNQGTTVIQEKFGFPIAVDFVFPTNTTFGFTVATTQKYTASKKVSVNGTVTDYTSVTNSVEGSDVTPPSSSQHYSFFDLNGRPYDCRIATQNNVLTSVSVGCNH
ncbi:MAG: peptide-N(4)-(N-acetyl-beta-glucosaminyl)asparagine amidase [Acidobacteria bacterium]|nr:MAG: peptide-N(4)-(N-acetyl-beta-glucosaminyl)asparagine amidase [Acidobacteriota bacterium]